MWPPPTMLDLFGKLDHPRRPIHGGYSLHKFRRGHSCLKIKGRKFLCFFVSSTLIMWEHRSDPIGTCLNLFNFQGFFSVNDPQKFSKIPSERYVSSDMDSWLKIILSILSSWPNFVKVGCWGVDEVSSGFENKKSTQLRWTRPSPTFLSPLPHFCTHCADETKIS